MGVEGEDVGGQHACEVLGGGLLGLVLVEGRVEHCKGTLHHENTQGAVRLPIDSQGARG